MSEIVNRIAKSKIEVIDLTDYYPKYPFVLIDVSQWMAEGLVVIEKEFRISLKQHDWQTYKNTYVAINCTTDAIVPVWAYALVATYLQPYAQKIAFGTIEELKLLVWEDIIKNFPVGDFKNKRVIVKGCSKKEIPTNAYILLINSLQTEVNSILLGEACSAVPLYKKQRK